MQTHTCDRMTYAVAAAAAPLSPPPPAPTTSLSPSLPEAAVTGLVFLALPSPVFDALGRFLVWTGAPSPPDVTPLMGGSSGFFPASVGLIVCGGCCCSGGGTGWCCACRGGC
jgi:hypothetical protein